MTQKYDLHSIFSSINHAMTTDLQIARTTAGHPSDKGDASEGEWVTLFKQTFKFTGGEIVGEFLLSTGYLPGAHQETCPVFARVLKKKPRWHRR